MIPVTQNDAFCHITNTTKYYQAPDRHHEDSRVTGLSGPIPPSMRDIQHHFQQTLAAGFSNSIP